MCAEPRREPFSGLGKKRWAQGLVNFVPAVTAVAYHYCLNLPAAFTKPGARLLAEPRELCLLRVSALRNGKYLGWAGQSRTFLGRPPRSDLRISHRFSPRPPPLQRCRRPDPPRSPRPPPPRESPSPTTAGSKLEEESEGAISGGIPKIHIHPSSEL